MSDEARRAAGILAQCKWLKDQVFKWEHQAKEVIARELEAGERTKALAPDGTEIGSVTRAEGARSMHIDSEEGFLMWVKQRYPTEVVETVRPAFVKLCGEKVKVLGCLPDANGELCPHVSLVRNEPSISAKLSDDNRAMIEQMLMSRHMPDVMAALDPPAVVQGDAAIAGVAHHMPGTVDGIRPHKQISAEEAEQMREAMLKHYVDVPLEVVYDGPLDDTTEAFQRMAYGDPRRTTGIPTTEAERLSQDETVEPEPFIEEGPPGWPESNTFETSDAVKNRRR